MVDHDWPYWVRGYYASDVEPPKRPGDLAFETKHRSEPSRDIEIEAAESDPNIGLVEWGQR